MADAIHVFPGDGSVAVVVDRPQRDRALDGLRGLGSLIVVVHHFLLIVPSISATIAIGQVGAVDAQPASVEWWLTRTPLRFFWAGQEAVLLFFTLSGFVLCLPLMGGAWRQKRGVWPSYYVRRLVRLYLPVWCALALAYAIAMGVSRRPGFGSSWLQSHVQPTLSVLGHDAVLLTGTSNLDSPLWSLQWEVWFSLLLPVMYLILRLIRVQKWWVLAVPLMAVTSILSNWEALVHHLPVAWTTVGLLRYMPIFAIGMTLCMVRSEGPSLARRPGHHAWLVGLVGVVATLSPVYMSSSTTFRTFVDAPLALASILGITTLLILALTSINFAGFLESRVMQWAGSRSFSIYLVHEPVIVATALVIHAHGWWPWLPLGLLVIPFCLLLSELFYRLAERPAHRLSRYVGSQLARHSMSARVDQPAADPGLS